jgi:hypothetical protein
MSFWIQAVGFSSAKSESSLKIGLSISNRLQKKKLAPFQKEDEQLGCHF